MFDGLMKSKFFSKCKSDIKLIRTRIEIIKKRRNVTQKYLRNDVADLLRNGFDVDAFGRAEGLLAEMVRSQCYELIDQYCEHILKNLSTMNKQRECPEECREAASSLMFAAARFADLPELRDLRTMFSERYGNSLDYYVNKQFSEKLKLDPPSNDMKLQLLQEIAAESGLDWDSKALENKLFKESAYDKKIVKETNDSDRPSHNRVKGSAQKASTGYEYSQARESTPEKKQDLPFHERKVSTRNEDRLPRNRDDVSPPINVKDFQVDKVRTTTKPNAATDVRKVSKKDDKVQPLKHRAIPPPYTKPEVNKANSSSTDESDSCNDKVEDDAVLGAKLMGKSVRTRNHKPSPGQEIAEGDEKEKERDTNKENVAQGRRILRFFDGGRDQQRGHDEQDEEEKMMDKLLRHYSRKKGPNKNGKSEAEHGPTDSSKVKNSLRASSLRVEPTSPTETPKKHSRATSFNPDLLNGNGHVHPKLPDYDEFVARLAAFRGK